MTQHAQDRRKEDQTFEGTERRQHRREEAEAWLFFIARVLAFMLGLVIVGFNLVVDKPEGVRLWLAVLVGVGFMWPIVGPGVTQAVAVMRGGSRE